MLSALKRLRVAVLTGALVFAFAGTALAAGPGSVSGPAVGDPIDIQLPDCYSACSKTLKPGERLVVGEPYGTTATVFGSATGAGVRFVVKRSPNGYPGTFTKLAESPSWTTTFGPVTFGGLGVYRAVAVNDNATKSTVYLSLATTFSEAGVNRRCVARRWRI
jgi:hypothetical protein